VSDQNEHEDLIERLESTVERGLGYFLGQGRASDVKVGDWGVWEVLCHMVYWHQATVNGVEAIAAGGDPYLIDGETDEVNDRIISSMAGRSSDELAEDIRGLQSRLSSAVRGMGDPTVTVFIRQSGASASALDRVEQITRHWQSHVDELTAAD